MLGREHHRLAVVVVAWLACMGRFGGRAIAEDEKSPPGPVATRGELLRDIMGAERTRRNRAATEAINAKALTEDDWLRVLDLRLATDDEQEEVKLHAARGLLGVGDKRCLARLVEMAREEPKCVVETTDAHGKAVRVAKHAYGFWASSAAHAIGLRVTFQAVRERLKDLPPRGRADALMAMWIEEAKSWRENKPAEFPETPPTWWRTGIRDNLLYLKRDGADAYARAIHSVEDPEVRAQVVYAMYEGFTRLEKELATDPGVQEAGMVALRGVLKRDTNAENEGFAFFIPGDRLKEMEEEVIAFVRRRAAGPAPGKDRMLGRAMNALGGLRTPRAMEFIVGWEGSWGDGGDLPAIGASEIFAPLLVRALERQAPEQQQRFDTLCRQIVRCLHEATRTERSKLDRKPAWRENLPWMIESLERSLARARPAVNFDAGGGGRVRALLREDVTLLEETIKSAREALKRPRAPVTEEGDE